MQYNYPFRINHNGRTEAVSEEDHIKQLIEQVLFTNLGERVNRPEFGCGILQLVFGPNGDPLKSATQALIQGALQQWLEDLIRVISVDVRNEDTILSIDIQYIIIRNQKYQSSSFRNSLVGIG